MSGSVPKASLYFYKGSVWSSAPLIALAEKGYGIDEVDLKEVDLHKGENFFPSFLRLNPQATVPTLAVPLSTTLDPDVESRYKTLQDTKSIIEFLDKSRSPQSKTRTTSSAPAPSLTPATIGFAASASKIIDILHSEDADPNALGYINARNDAELKALSQELLPILNAKCDALSTLIKNNENAQVRLSEKTVKFWELKREATKGILSVFEDAEKSKSDLDPQSAKKRTEYFNAAEAAWEKLKEVLLQLHQEAIGPYVLGDQISLADIHFAAWLARVAKLSGATAADDGNTVIAKIEQRIGGSFVLPKDISIPEARRKSGLAPGNFQPTDMQSKFAAFWDAMKERSSWKKVYADGLH